MCTHINVCIIIKCKCIIIDGCYISGWPRSLEIRENRENGQNKFPAGKNQGISKFKKNQGIIREFYNSEEKKCVYW